MPGAPGMSLLPRWTGGAIHRGGRRDQRADRCPGPGRRRPRRAGPRGLRPARRQAAARRGRRDRRRRRRRGDDQPAARRRRARDRGRAAGDPPDRRHVADLDPRRAAAAAAHADGRAARPRPARGERHPVRGGCAARAPPGRPASRTATSRSASSSGRGTATRWSTGWSSRCSAGCTPVTPAASPHGRRCPSSSTCSPARASRCRTARPRRPLRCSPASPAGCGSSPTRSGRRLARDDRVEIRMDAVVRELRRTPEGFAVVADEPASEREPRPAWCSRRRRHRPRACSRDLAPARPPSCPGSATPRRPW